MFDFWTKKPYLLFYIIIIFAETNADTPIRAISVDLQPPVSVNRAQPNGQSQLDGNAYLVNYFIEKQNPKLQLQIPANSYGVNTPLNLYGSPGLNNNPAPASFGSPDPSYQVEVKKTTNYNSKSNPFTLTVTNVTSDVRGNLDLPFGNRNAIALTYPPIEEAIYPNKNSYGQGGYYNNNENNVKFSGDPAINFGSIVTDTFVLKERISRAPSSNANTGPGRPVSDSSTSNTQDRASILNGILSTVIENGPSAINVSSSSQSQIPTQSQKEEIHSPGDLIAREIPMNGEMNFNSLDNLTEFLIDDASKFRPNGRRDFNSKEQVPMFVAVQYYTVGRNKFKTNDERAQKNSRIHVVLGHKHFSYKNIKNLNELYDYVNQDYEAYQPNGKYGYNPFDAQPKFRISKVIIDLIIEFVHFSWKVHQDFHIATEARGDDISKRIAKLLRQNAKNKPKFRPNKSQEELPTDFFTWAYTNTLGYRTLV